jgi:hypothetical protein
MLQSTGFWCMKPVGHKGGGGGNCWALEVFDIGCDDVALFAGSMLGYVEMADI